MSGPVELSKRAVACSGWEWLGGIQAFGRIELEGAPIGKGKTGVFLVSGAFQGNPVTVSKQFPKSTARAVIFEAMPIWDHAGTKGCLLQMLRTAFKDPHLYVRADNNEGYGPWVFQVLGRNEQGNFCHLSQHEDEAEVMVMALEKAHQKALDAGDLR